MKAVYSIVFIFCFCGLINRHSVAQEYYQPGSPAKSLADITVCLSDGWSAFGNQAGLAGVNHFEAGISCSNHFLLQGLSLKATYVSIPVRRNNFSISFYRFGNLYYNENKLGFSYAQKLTPHFFAGFQFNYLFICFPENSKSPGDFCFEGGIQYHLHDKFLMGMHCFNPLQSGIKTESYKYKFPCLFRLGIAMKLTGELSLYSELEKDLRYSPSLKLGVEYIFQERFRLRGGVSGKNNLFTMGVAYTAKRIITDFAWQYNQRLGSTPSVSIRYFIK